MSKYKLRKQLQSNNANLNDKRFTLKESFVQKRTKVNTQSQTVTDLSPTHTSSRTAEFIAKLMFFQHTCLLSFQKASLAIDLCFNLFVGVPPPDRFVPSPATLSTWSIVLGEADKINLRRKFNQSQFEFHIWADDSNKGNTDRHVVGIHT